LTGRARYRRLALALLAALFTAALAAGALGAAAALAHLAPAILAFRLLGLGRYPGECVLAGLSRPAARLGRGAARATGGQRALGVPRGGLLLAAALAGRAPPPGLLPLWEPTTGVAGARIDPAPGPHS